MFDFKGFSSLCGNVLRIFALKYKFFWLLFEVLLPYFYRFLRRSPNSFFSSFFFFNSSRSLIYITLKQLKNGIYFMGCIWCMPHHSTAETLQARPPSHLGVFYKTKKSWERKGSNGRIRSGCYQALIWFWSKYISSATDF